MYRPLPEKWGFVQIASEKSWLYWKEDEWVLAPVEEIYQHVPVKDVFALNRLYWVYRNEKTWFAPEPTPGNSYYCFECKGFCSLDHLGAQPLPTKAIPGTDGCEPHYVTKDNAGVKMWNMPILVKGVYEKARKLWPEFIDILGMEPELVQVYGGFTVMKHFSKEEMIVKPVVTDPKIWKMPDDKLVRDALDLGMWPAWDQHNNCWVAYDLKNPKPNYYLFNPCEFAVYVHEDDNELKQIPMATKDDKYFCPFCETWDGANHGGGCTHKPSLKYYGDPSFPKNVIWNLERHDTLLDQMGIFIIDNDLTEKHEIRMFLSPEKMKEESETIFDPELDGAKFASLPKSGASLYSEIANKDNGFDFGSIQETTTTNAQQPGVVEVKSISGNNYVIQARRSSADAVRLQIGYQQEKLEYSFSVGLGAAGKIEAKCLGGDNPPQGSLVSGGQVHYWPAQIIVYTNDGDNYVELIFHGYSVTSKLDIPDWLPELAKKEKFHVYGIPVCMEEPKEEKKVVEEKAPPPPPISEFMAGIIKKVGEKKKGQPKNPRNIKSNNLKDIMCDE